MQHNCRPVECSTIAGWNFHGLSICIFILGAVGLAAPANGTNTNASACVEHDRRTDLGIGFGTGLACGLAVWFIWVNVLCRNQGHMTDSQEHGRIRGQQDVVHGGIDGPASTYRVNEYRGMQKLDLVEKMKKQLADESPAVFQKETPMTPLPGSVEWHQGRAGAPTIDSSYLERTPHTKSPGTRQAHVDKYLSEANA